MKRLVIVLTLLALAVPTLSAQRRSRGYWHREALVTKEDTILVVHMLPVVKYNRKPDLRRYQRLVRAVKKVYPLAKEARREMEEMEMQLSQFTTKKEREAHMKGVQKRLIRKYTPILLKMTFFEGQVLLKLIDRETEYTAFQIVKEFRGGFVAGFWQAIARLFGNNLKLEFDPNKRDLMLEQIVHYYEMGWL